MKIWDVCEVHESRKYVIKQPPNRCDFVMLHGNWKSDPFCVFVPMRLIPDNAWSGKLVKRISEAIKTTIWKVPTGTDHEEAAFAAAVAALEAIDAFALDGETP